MISRAQVTSPVTWVSAFIYLSIYLSICGAPHTVRGTCGTPGAGTRGRTYRAWPPRGRLPCASGAYSTQVVVRVAPYVQYGGPVSIGAVASRRRDVLGGPGRPRPAHPPGSHPLQGQ
eukprot:scaffold50319_cov39-Phaeocystis_antarctica.AAC.1